MRDFMTANPYCKPGTLGAALGSASEPTSLFDGRQLWRKTSMRVRVAVVQSLLLATVAGPLFAQSPAPTLSNIESPYAPIQGSVQMGGVVYSSGAVAYGPAPKER
jgi:hypothetical protein